MNKNKNVEIIVTLIVFALVYGFIIQILPWNLIFTDTMISGGDTGSHNYTLYHLKTIFPKIKTWSPDWYAGFPFLYFYPPLLFIITVLLSFLIPLNIAFKLITLAGTFLLPLALYWCLKNCDQKFPIPQIGALGSLFFLFLEKFSIYGANLPSTLAGEFSYSFSLSLFFIFLGFLVKGLKENKYLILNTILLSLIVLSHLVPVAIAIILAPFLIFLGDHTRKEYRRRFFYLIKVFGLAFCLTAWWSLPFLAFSSYTSMMHWAKTIVVSEILPPSLFIFWTGAILGLIFAIWKADKNILAIIITTLASFLVYLTLNNSAIYNTRFLPPVILGYILIGSYGWGKLIQLCFKKNETIISAILIFASICSWYLVKQDITFIPDWLKWNYEGFEAKAPFQREAQPLFQYLKNLPPGRIMWEYRNSEYDACGTPRFLENLPIWTEHPTYEGLLIESSLSGPFHFINQAETSITPSSAIAGFEYPPFNFEKGVKHLQMFGAKYFVAYSDEVKNQADQYLTKLKDFEHFAVYEIPQQTMIDIPSGFTLEKKKKDWVYQSIDWYKNANLNIPIIFYQNQKEYNQIVALQEKIQGPITKDIHITKNTDTALEFTTKALYAPHIIKISYFPDWQVKGAYGPYLVSPSFMVVFPYQNNVLLEFKPGPIDITSYILSLTSFVFLCILIIDKRQKLAISKRFLSI